MPYSPGQTQDDEHLKLLAIFHYVLGGLSFLATLGGVLYLFAGFFFFQQAITTAGSTTPAPPAEIGWIFAFIGGLVALFGVAIGVCLILAGRSLTARRNRTFCLVIAGINCLHFPLGTLLGVFTFIVLMRPAIAAQFERSR
ncbi:MAG TPA: hypothetical protein VIM57_07635 [Luteolibacter sp.]